MKPSFEPFPLIHVDETDSTNSYLQKLAARRELEEFTTVTAGFQTSGRGQRGNSWESGPDENLLFSFVLFPRFVEVRSQFSISQIVSLSVKEELDTYTSGISVKWPNDVYWRDRKICGMLIENNLTGKTIDRSIVGIGINVNQEVFRSLAPNPVSLRQITGRLHDRAGILRNVISRVRSYYRSLREGKTLFVAERYGESLFRKEGFHGYKDVHGKFLARIVGVESDGRLVLEDGAGVRRKYFFKEVEYLWEPAGGRINYT